MKTVLRSHSIVLKQLTLADAEAFHALYLPNDQKPAEFTAYIASLCNDLFTIRTTKNPSKIIGDCALHHWNKEKKEIEIGGTLLPEYWGKGIMASAFGLLILLAKDKYNIDKIVAKTEITNTKALKFAEKMGFVRIGVLENEVLLEKMVKI